MQQTFAAFLFSLIFMTGCADPTPSTPDVQTKEVVYEVGGVTCTGYLAWDANGKAGQRPGVLVVHEWWGHNEYARKRARMLAESGYTALAVDMYGDGKSAEHPKDAQKFSSEVFANIDAAKARFEKARAILQQHPSSDPEKVAAIGYCFGGGVVLHMARFGMDLDGVASFHGSLATQTPAQKGQVKARVLVCHGADDQLIQPKVVEAFMKEMRDAGVNPTFHSYKGAQHSFTNPEADEKAAKFGLPLAYNEQADKQSWAALEKFLGELWAE